MERRKVEVDPYGIKKEYYFDTWTGQIVSKKTQDLAPVFRQTRKFIDMGFKPQGDFRMVANIPFVLISEWGKQGFDYWTASEEEINKKLNDPDYKKLRVWEGRL